MPTEFNIQFRFEVNTISIGLNALPCTLPVGFTEEDSLDLLASRSDV